MTMILYYSPGACSLVPHIALEEANADFRAERVAIADGAHRSAEYLAINPVGRVPALATDDGVITENIAVLTYVAVACPAVGSIPLADAFAAARCMQLLSWFASGVHIGFAQVWRPERFTDDISVHPEIQKGGSAVLQAAFAEIENQVGDDWLAGDRFTAADTYALTFLRWGLRIGFDMTAYPRWSALAGRVLERAAVRRAIAREGLDVGQFQLND